MRTGHPGRGVPTVKPVGAIHESPGQFDRIGVSCIWVRMWKQARRDDRKGSPYAKNRCGPDTPGWVSLREFFGIMRIDLALHGRAVGLRPPQRKISEYAYRLSSAMHPLPPSLREGDRVSGGGSVLK